MKLIIQIPCFNEAATLPLTLKDLPRKIEGVDTVEILVIDDGSTDNTYEVARQLGVDHIVRMTKNQGLAKAFVTGLDACLRLKADIIVNTDADNQYAGCDIPLLIDPILHGSADVVIGDRQTDGIGHFSWTKKRLQSLGSWAVRQLSGTQVADATSGFRAISREAALQMNVLSRFTYTLETIIQAGKKNLAITDVPVHTNSQVRKSRLFSSNWSYIKRSIATITRIYTLYEPLKIFSYIGALIFAVGLIIGLRFIYFYLFYSGSGHIQSLILAAVLLIVGFQVFIMALLADLISFNRQLLENVLYRLRKMESNDKP
ncbi:MAG TPA: glycosyltransferase family 2 protein [bacterium]|nr:glycosyltransferase family 2 protein [bacterium]HNT65121.1 glycosyltransferase family 2 protein [bacterium]HOX86351.1 glycosyltransferase family 2 protein [bacterium]HPG45820.1 glycosyltransferase family 2 protein [bacterium]HPM97953.1 glycosyltransferase family 2 protein [bacterium]